MTPRELETLTGEIEGYRPPAPIVVQLVQPTPIPYPPAVADVDHTALHILIFLAGFGVAAVLFVLLQSLL